MKRRTFLWATVGTVGALAGLAVGWAAWLALYWARRNALGRLRMAANRLHR